MSKARDLSDIPAGGYDVNFYEDTGTTPKFFWDASAEALGIGTSSPSYKLDVASSVLQLGNSTDAFVQHKSTAGNWHVGANSSNAYVLYSGSYGTGTERMRLDFSGNLKFNSGYGSVATAYGCRAWVSFNGTGTVAIRGNGNVSSITDNGTGQYAVNFSTAMPDTNYCVTLGSSDGGWGAKQVSGFHATTSVRVYIRRGDTDTFSDVDASDVFCAIHR